MPAPTPNRRETPRRRARRPCKRLLFAAALLAGVALACGRVNLLATPTASPSGAAPAQVVSTPSPTPTPFTLRFFDDPPCVQYDEYQSSSLAFYSLAAFVQTGIDRASADAPAEGLAAATARFEATIRRALAGEAVVASDAVEELALFWVASDGCMR